MSLLNYNITLCHKIWKNITYNTKQKQSLVCPKKERTNFEKDLKERKEQPEIGKGKKN